METGRTSFHFSDLDTVFQIHLNRAQHPDGLAMLIEIVNSTTENRELLEAGCCNLLESLKLKRDSKDFFRYADVPLRAGYLTWHAEFLISGLEILEREGRWLFHEQEVIDTLFRYFGRYDDWRFEPEEGHRARERFQRLLRNAVERALEARDEHGRVAFAYFAGKNWTHELYRLLKTIFDRWDDAGQFFDHALQLAGSDDAAADELDEIAEDVLMHLARELRVAYFAERVTCIYTAIRDKRLNGEYGDRLNGLIDGYRKKIASFAS